MAPAHHGDEACCPRCGSGFHCGIDDAEPCACSALKLDAGTLAKLQRQYQGCLCLRCLSALATAQTTSTGDTA